VPLCAPRRATTTMLPVDYAPVSTIYGPRYAADRPSLIYAGAEIGPALEKASLAAPSAKYHPRRRRPPRCSPAMLSAPA